VGLWNANCCLAKANEHCNVCLCIAWRLIGKKMVY
jgi:hypothetical protein